MAINSKGRIEITDLDFDTVKSNFKSFLSQQTQFTDYNFEGSGMSVLMDLLAYNTHYLAFHANMLANEMFIDTALTRASAVSHAKSLGYTPTSTKAPVAYVDVTVQDANTASQSLLFASIIARNVSSSRILATTESFFSLKVIVFIILNPSS